MNNRYFITIDAETALLPKGIQIIADIREEVEGKQRLKIPLVWFVRFQRSWGEYVNYAAADYFAGPVTARFDGFELAKSQLIELARRGDEIGWHYHAYNYVHRDDLSHATRIEILKADLVACANELRTRHPCFRIRTFRFGWFFVPDYGIFDVLSAIGISSDASVRLSHGGRNVANFTSKYLPPITTSPRRIGKLAVFPYDKTLLIHDWSVVAHEFVWSSLNEPGAVRNRELFRNNIVTIASDLNGTGGAFSTYETFPVEELAIDGESA
jgi:hypothetical protein